MIASAPVRDRHRLVRLNAGLSREAISQPADNRLNNPELKLVPEVPVGIDDDVGSVQDIHIHRAVGAGRN